jgi:hypothetical protein
MGAFGGKGTTFDDFVIMQMLPMAYLLPVSTKSYYCERKNC